MRLAVLQAAARPQTSGPDPVLANLAVVDAAARRAAAAGADLLVTPELFPTGYAPGSVVPDARIVPALCATAASCGVAVVASEPCDGRITAAVVSSGGFHVPAQNVARPGGSVVIGADGRVLTAAAADTPDLLVADVTRARRPGRSRRRRLPA